MPSDERFADPLTERLAAFAHGIGRNAPLQFCGMSCAPRISTEIVSFPPIWRWLR